MLRLFSVDIQADNLTVWSEETVQDIIMTLVYTYCRFIPNEFSNQSCVKLS